MKKYDELTTPTSCLNKAADDEPLFVIRAKDPLAPALVQHWANLAVQQKLHEPEKIEEARACARSMDAYRRAREATH